MTYFAINLYFLSSDLIVTDNLGKKVGMCMCDWYLSLLSFGTHHHTLFFQLIP